MSKTDADVGTGLVGAPACGDVMKLQIRVDKENKTISDVKFKTFGCGSAIASSSYLTELVRGMTLEEAGRIRNTEIAKELCLPPVKRESPKIMTMLLLESVSFLREVARFSNFLFWKIQCTAPCLQKMRSSPQSRITTPRIRMQRPPI